MRRGGAQRGCGTEHKLHCTNTSMHVGVNSTLSIYTKRVLLSRSCCLLCCVVASRRTRCNRAQCGLDEIIPKRSQFHQQRASPTGVRSIPGRAFCSDLIRTLGGGKTCACDLRHESIKKHAARARSCSCSIRYIRSHTCDAIRTHIKRYKEYSVCLCARAIVTTRVTVV